MAFALGPTGFHLLAPGDQFNKVNMNTHLADFNELFEDFEELWESVMKNRKILLYRAYRYNKNPALKKLYAESQISENQSISES